MVKKIELEELREQLFELLLQANKLKISIGNADALANSPEASADRLHRSVAFLAVKVSKADPSFDSDSVFEMLDLRRQEIDYHHHDFVPEDAEFPEDQSFMEIAKGSCRVCGAVKPRDPRLTDLPCRGPAVLAMR